MAACITPLAHAFQTPDPRQLHHSDELYDDDLSLSDDDNMSSDDSSAYPSPARPSWKPYVSEVSSPTSVSDVTMTSTATTRPKQRRKRNRMSEDERKVRHREVQRQFMKRKRARIAELRKGKSSVEKQLRLVRVLVEVEQLKIEQTTLQQQYEQCEKEESPVVVTETVDQTVSHRSFEDLVFSVPSEDVYEDAEITATEWDALYELLSDDACADLGL